MNIIGKYLLNILIAVDEFGNALTAGDPGETISSRLGRIKAKNKGVIPWHRPVAKVIAWGLDKIQPGHVEHAIEPPEQIEGDEGIVDKP